MFMQCIRVEVWPRCGRRLSAMAAESLLQKRSYSSRARGANRHFGSRWLADWWSSLAELVPSPPVHQSTIPHCPLPAVCRPTAGKLSSPTPYRILSLCMGFIIEAVATYAAYIYALCGLVALYHIYKVWLVRSERRQAVFSLEREKAMRELFGIFYVAMLLVGLMGVTYFVSTTLAQAVEPIVAESRSPQPNLPFMPTPTTTPLPITLTPVVNAVVSLPTPTAPATGTVSADTTVQLTAEASPAPETPTPVPAAPAASSPACGDPRAAISSPGNGQTVSGVISIQGTAMHESFQYYKVEFAPGANASGGFVYLGGGNSPVQGGVLANVDTAALGPGQWTLRLVVVDQTGNFPDPCAVTITVGG